MPQIHKRCLKILINERLISDILAIYPLIQHSSTNLCRSYGSIAVSYNKEIGQLLLRRYFLTASHKAERVRRHSKAITDQIVGIFQRFQREVKVLRFRKLLLSTLRKHSKCQNT